MDRDKILDYVKIILIISIAIALAAFALNQFMDFTSKAQLLKDPCSLCNETKKIINIGFDLSNISFG
jgi:hypothetical protein